MSPERSGAVGEVVALFLLEQHGAPLRPVAQATAIVQQGLAGDLHSGGKPGRSRQVLLMDAADLALMGLKPGELREQITVRMEGLMALSPSARLQVGEAVLEIGGPCEPCTHIGELLRQPDREAFRVALIGHRGMLARVVEVRGAGRIRVGDAVRPLAPTIEGARG